MDSTGWHLTGALKIYPPWDEAGMSRRHKDVCVLLYAMIMKVLVHSRMFPAEVHSCTVL